MKKFFLLFVYVGIASALFATERITDFSGYMRINQDGSAQVTEKISLIAEHQKIRRGIYRELPNTYGEPIHEISLYMDGKEHPFFTEKRGHALRINFGDDNYISKGEHTYRLQYTIDNVVRLFPKHDEIYWNVIGKEWSFPIEKSSFQLQLPAGAQPNISRISSYVGKAGTKGIPANRQDLLFWVDSPLQPGQAFTVAVPWQKGIIHVNSNYFKKYLIPLGLFLGLLLLWSYYGWAWNHVGRDPKAHVFTQYEPPEGFSAVKTLYVYSMGQAKTKLLSTIVISLSVKGALEIKEESSFFGKQTLLVKKQGLSAGLLSLEEAMVCPALFRGQNKLYLKNNKSNQSAFQQIYQELDFVLQKETSNLFTTNKWYNIPTFVYLAVISAVLTPIPAPDSIQFWLISTTLLSFCTCIVHSFIQSCISWKDRLFLLIYAGCLGFAFFDSLFLIDFWTIITLVFALLAVISGGFFMQWIKAYSIFGRDIMDHIEGFKHYLEIGEKGRVEQSNPTDALRIFCDYLPYAHALGVENKWIKQFEQHFSTQQIHTALLVRGIALNSTSNLSAAMSSAFSSISSGTGGGGFAGGGSGGGGGGGR